MKQRIPTFENFSINENPDKVSSKNFKGYHTWSSSDARPIGYLKGKMLIGDLKSRHKEQSPPKNRHDFESPGRIWENDKIISFWRLNSPLKNIIKDINVVLTDIGADFQIDSSWKIEVAKIDKFEGDDIEKIKFLINLFDFAKKEKNGKTSKYDCEWERITKDWGEYYVSYVSSHTSFEDIMDDTPIGW